MAKEIVWERLTPTEAQTLAELNAAGIEVYAAPIEIEKKAEDRQAQFESLGITQADCKTWRIGSEKVIVHLTPAPKHVYDFMLNELRAKHRDEYRNRRCQVPGKRKGTLIMCPECNRCCECPFPEYRDQHKARIVSRDEMLESGYEGEADTRMIEQLDAKLQYEEIREIMNKENPLITQVFEKKERDGLSNKEIAAKLGITKRQTYYLYSKALAIGQKYNRS